MTAESWFRQLLGETRARDSTLDPKAAREARGVRSLHLHPPCQIRVFHIEHPEAYFAIVTHSSTSPDGEIRVSRPLKLPEVLTEFEKALDEPMWAEPVEPGDGAFFAPGEKHTLRGIGERALMNAWHHIERLPFHEYREYKHLQSWGLGQGAAAIWHEGPLDVIDPREVAEENHSSVVHEIQERPKRMDAAHRLPKAAPPKAQKEKYEGWGVWLHPRPRIGERPTLPLRERLWRGPFTIEASAPCVTVHTPQGWTVIASYDGFVGARQPIGKQSPDFKERVVGFHNALGYILGEADHPVLFALDHEFAGFEMDARRSETETLSPRVTPHTYRNTISFADDNFVWPAAHISTKAFETYIQLALEVYNSPQLEHAQMLVEAYTQLYNSRPTESFFHSWLVLERLVNQDWDAYTKRPDFTEARLKRLDDKTRWFVDDKIEILSLADALTLDYGSLMSYKGRRNDYLHGTKRASMEDARALLDLARDELRKKLKLSIPTIRQQEAPSGLILGEE